MARPVNPFEFGGELKPSALIDRDEELALVISTIESGGKLFLMGPRRYGKTSILAAAEHRLAGSGIAVLRYDAEVYETLGRLAEALLAGAARKLTPTLEKAGEAVKRLASRFKPQVDYDFEEQKLSLSLGPAARTDPPLPLLTEVLNIIDRMASDTGRRAAVILDEFQQVIVEGGESAERQLRGTVQRHHHTAYVFAGSKTRMLADMTQDAGRPFWKLGTRLYLGPIPREAWRKFLAAGFARSEIKVQPAALERLMDVSEDVPFNIQQLAHTCWESLRGGAGAGLTAERVGESLQRIVARENPSYTQLWNSLTRAQKIATRAVIDERGVNLRAAATLARYGLPAATMHKALSALESRGIVREDEAIGSIRHRLQDPFFAHWLKWAQGS